MRNFTRRCLIMLGYRANYGDTRVRTRAAQWYSFSKQIIYLRTSIEVLFFFMDSYPYTLQRKRQLSTNVCHIFIATEHHMAAGKQIKQQASSHSHLVMRRSIEHRLGSELELWI